MVGNYIYCPQCAAPLAEGEKFGRRRRYCRYCGFIYFREPKVAVIALVEHHDRILLIRRAVAPRIGYWSLPGGYMDADERPTEAVVREIREETNVDVRVTDLYTVHSMMGHGVTGGNGTAPKGIVLVYQASWVSGQPEPNDDVSEAGWFGVDEVPWGALAFDTTDRFLRSWAQKCRGL
jgi:ADP-ribose pyrophosphatase YjhB (NUDIX family)